MKPFVIPLSRAADEPRYLGCWMPCALGKRVVMPGQVGAVGSAEHRQGFG